MDMPTPHFLGPVADHNSRAKLDAVAQALGCSTDLFFKALNQPTPADTAKLLQMWLMIRSPESRNAVFNCVREILNAQQDYKTSK